MSGSQNNSPAEQNFTIDQIFSSLPEFKSRGITELTIADRIFSSDKNGILRLAAGIKKHCPDLFFSLLVDPQVIDPKFISVMQELFVSLEMNLEGSVKNGKLLFDKKLFSRKCAMLNDAGMIFGFNMNWGEQEGDTFKAFRDRIDFAVSLYPNHIDFGRLENDPYSDPSSTGIYSSKDLDFSRGMAFACNTFYSEGRAVPWFNSVMKALKINPSAFFSDFEEFQLCNNCSFEVGFNPKEAGHKAIEKLQLMFLGQKFAEKQKSHYMPAVRDMVQLNGAFSRVMESRSEETIETFYHPDDLLSPYAFSIQDFVENVTMESCQVTVFDTPEGPDYRVG